MGLSLQRAQELRVWVTANHNRNKVLRRMWGGWNAECYWGERHSVTVSATNARHKQFAKRQGSSPGSIGPVTFGACREAAHPGGERVPEGSNFPRGEDTRVPKSPSKDLASSQWASPLQEPHQPTAASGWEPSLQQISLEKHLRSSLYPSTQAAEAEGLL